MPKKLFRLSSKNRGKVPIRVSKTSNISSYQHVKASDLVICSTAEAREMISYERAVEFNVLPLGILKMEKEDCVTLASGIECPDLSSALRFLTGKRIKLIEAPKEIIKEAVFKAYKGKDDNLSKAAKKISSDQDAKPQKPDFRSHANDALSFLTYLVDYAVAKDASDIHLIPQRSGAFVRIRVNGKLLDHDDPFGTPEVLTQIITRIKVIAGLDTSNRTQPQDGRFSIPTPLKDVDARVSIMPTIHGEKAVIRLIGTQKHLKFNELGLSVKLEGELKNILNTPQGAVVLAGPTGSGKSSTLYSMLGELSDSGLSLISIEDPVEIISDVVTQISVDHKRGLDYPACLKSVLRQDPDVILIGEIRDEESARTAFDSAVTGHMLLTTVHASNVFEVLLRLQRLGVDSLTISQALRAVVSQRLAPKLCCKCKVIDLAGSKESTNIVYKAVGCSQCDYSGFYGRTLLTESLIVDEQIAQAIAAGKGPAEIKGLLNSDNYLDFTRHIIEKVEAGELESRALSHLQN